MSIEGGAFKCTNPDHKGFKTESVDEWDEHCYKTKHTLTAKHICPNCGTENIDPKYPYPKGYVRNAHTVGSGIVVECKKCFGSD